MSLTVKLNDGKQIPAVGFGNMHGWENDYTQKAEDLPAFALKQGFRHLDTAEVSTQSAMVLILDLPNGARDCRRDQSCRHETGRCLGDLEE